MKISGFPILLGFIGLVTVTSLKVRGAGGAERIELYTNHYLAAEIRNLRYLKVKNTPTSVWSLYEENLLNSAESRYSGNPKIFEAAAYIESEFRALGLEVSFDEFPSSDSSDFLTNRNIIGRLGGSGESILVGAHYDSLPRAGAAPGADDNASGVATLLSVARALSTSNLKRSVVFVAFSGEEAGMVGSSHFANLVAPNFNIVGAIVLDMNGNPGTDRGILLESVGDSPDKLRVIDTIADSMDPGIRSFVVNHDGFGSDHVPLSSIGIPSVLVIESENMKFSRLYGHTDRDVLSNIDPSFGAEIANTVTSAVVRLAMA